MKPLDARLLRYARASRWFLAATAGLALLQTAAIIAFSWLVSEIVVLAFLQHASLADLAARFGALAGVVLARAALNWAQDALSATAAARITSQLRAGMLAKIDRLGPSWLASRRASDLAVTAGRGLDALDPYFSQYVPQLVLTAIATPVLILTLVLADPLSSLVVIITLPLIPVFMILIGWFTQNVQSSQWSALGKLSAHFLDVVEGLSTLKIFRRDGHQERVIARVTDDYRVRTMKVLRVSFVSGFVLELAATLSVALVAVSIGTRLVAGQMELLPGLFVLLLTPECYLPLRNVGASFHAAAEGVEASNQVFEVLDEPEPPARSGGTAAAEPGTVSGLELRDLLVRPGEGVEVAVAELAMPAGEITVVVGPSGAGKSTTFAALLGFVRPERGTVTVLGPHASRHVDLAAGSDVRDLVAWSGQEPHLRDGTVSENVQLGALGNDPAILREAMRLAGLGWLDPDRRLEMGGAGVSGGQAQRISLARAYYRALERGLPVLLLDEPTSALDEQTERGVIAGWRELADRGLAVVVVSHRPAVMDAADRRTEVRRVVAAH